MLHTQITVYINIYIFVFLYLHVYTHKQITITITHYPLHTPLFPQSQVMSVLNYTQFNPTSDYI